MEDNYLSFSQRMGMEPVKKSIQIEGMDEKLRVCIYNGLYEFLYNYIKTKGNESLLKKIWKEFWFYQTDKYPKGEMHNSGHGIVTYFNHKFDAIFEKYFFSGETLWGKIYDLLEFVNLKLEGDANIALENYRKVYLNLVNNSLELGSSGYTFINGFISPITNKEEIIEIQAVFDNTKPFTALFGCNTHLTTALQLLSNRENPDYRNSIKESISAVEFICKKISSKKTLGDSSKKMRSIPKFNPFILDSMEKLYTFSNKVGARHAIPNEEDAYEVDLEDARYMLVSCSAFINYLIVKAEKAGIDLSEKK
jgi:hypothetical protein